jgi:UDP-glucose 4-epimerase
MMRRKRFFVAGGAGFVGSHLVLALADLGQEVVVLDNFRTGHRAAVPAGVRLIEGDLADRQLVNDVLSDGPWEAAYHFAALSLVGESMREPYRYLMENAVNGISLIEACVRHGVPKFVLSSTANLFGRPMGETIDEACLIEPASPYGESKLMVERALFWADRIHGLNSACLRYFNAAGADPKGRIGEDHRPETHVIPLAIDAALGRLPQFTVFGTDYDTPDGTCLRDYIHVSDLADAHLRVLRRLESGSVAYNLGNGAGFSVMDVVRAVEDVTGRRVPMKLGERRPGDPARLVACSDLIRRETGWAPQHAGLHEIVRTAAEWRIAHAQGYDGAEAAVAA